MRQAYIETSVVSAIVKDDMPGESETLTQLLKVAHEKKIKLVGSKITRQELESWRDPVKRTVAERVNLLLEHVEFIEDHRVYGANMQFDRWGGMTYPLVGDEPISAALRRLGIERLDAHHLMVAIHAKCDVFLAYDHKTILKKRDAIEQRFSIKLLTPAEFLRSL